jgi:hypothetical protein
LKSRFEHRCQVRDELGHTAGDDLLERPVERASVREDDRAGAIEQEQHVGRVLCDVAPVLFRLPEAPLRQHLLRDIVQYGAEHLA